MQDHLGQCTSGSVWQYENHNNQVHPPMKEVYKMHYFKWAPNLKILNQCMAVYI